MRYLNIVVLAAEALDACRREEMISLVGQELFVRFCLALDLALWEAIDPHRLPWQDRQKFEEDPSWQDGWDAAMDYVARRADELLSTVDESGGPWPDSAESFRRERDLVHRHRAESYRKP